MSIHNLEGTFGDDELNEQFGYEQIDVFYEKFTADFLGEEFELNGKKVKVIKQKSFIAQYNRYCETFVHIISRSTIPNGRLYLAERANRVHWVKPILLAHPHKDIFYYKWKDDNGVCKEHFWYFKKDFMVVLKDVAANCQVVTAFCVDGDQKLRFYERFKEYEDGNGTC